MDPSELFRLTDRVAIVTGGSSGLGAHAAVGFAEAGADVVIVARRSERLTATRNKVEGTGRRCLAIVGDVSDPETALRTVDAAIDAFGKVDTLLNNAGVASAAPATRDSVEDFRRVQEINVNGSYWMAQACGRVMEPGSAIINVSSVVGLMTLEIPQASYAASKAAIVGLTRDLAAQWTGRKGIRVNAIAPGLFPSEITAQTKSGYLDRMIDRVPAGRMGHPGEFVAAVIFLASDAASYISGATLPVDGALLA